MAHPYETAQNPSYPGLLDPPGTWSPRACSEQGQRMANTTERRSRTDSSSSSPTSSRSPHSPRSPCPSDLCVDEWDLADFDLGDITEDVMQEVATSFDMVGLEDHEDCDGSGRNDVPAISHQAPEGALAIGSVADSDHDISNNFASYFLQESISKVCRLNYMYECLGQDPHFNMLRDMGITLHECAFPDGEIPSTKTIQTFLAACRENRKRGNQRIAVHCMAGLGRTGTLIATYAAAHHGVPGRAWHGWVRMCRPGSIQTERQEQFVRRLTAVSSKTPRITIPKSPSFASVTSLVRRVSSWGSNLSGASTRS